MRLFLLDGMALVYRGHFALIGRPIFTSKGVNTSALYVFTQTLLDILKNREPTHITAAFDTAAPTERHEIFPDYKVQREAMPEELAQALPHVRRLLAAFNIPVLTCDGYEADDIIGTLVRHAEPEGFTSYMVTPDKDFGQLVTAKTFLYRPSRMGDAVEIMGVPEILNRWGVQRTEQIPDVLGLWGDTSDNIPGVPGIGEKTATKLIAEYGSIENLLAHTHQLKGRVRENLEKFTEQARLSKKLATINCNVPCPVEFQTLRLQPKSEQAVREIFTEFEFNALGKRLFGEDFRAAPGRARAPAHAPAEPHGPVEAPERVPAPALQNIHTVKQDYRVLTTAAGRSALIDELKKQKQFALATAATDPDPKRAELLGLAFSFMPHAGFFAPFPEEPGAAREMLEDFRPVLENEHIEKIGHDLKYILSLLAWHGVNVRGGLFDTFLAHSAAEPDMRHSLDYLAEVFLAYSATPISKLIGEKKSELLPMREAGLQPLAEHATEDADLNLQLRSCLEPLLERLGQKRVFYEIEMPLLPVLVAMEVEGIRVDAQALAEFADQLARQMTDCERSIGQMAGRGFNLNSPRQLGEILFDDLKISDAPRRTRTGQYATDEQTLAALAPRHEIVSRLLDYRMMSKLKSTYADALPAAILEKTGRVHTTYNQLATATGRLNSQNPNLQNIPIRTELGQEIRKAFVPRNREYLLLSADYSQIELRIIAALGHERGLLEAFETGTDIHAATAAKVFNVPLDRVKPDMRRKAKMVNYGIAYGISAFGLSQRLAIPRSEGAAIIEAYFERFPGVRQYMTRTIEFAREHGYVETVTGRRRYIRDIRSRNATLRNAAERNAINAPIQGTAADMIKLAMINIHRELKTRELRTRMLLQVHDELVFDLFRPEETAVRALVEDKMKSAIALEAPLVIEVGVGENWLEAH